MSMPIQRQSESFGIFDDGPRYARDKSNYDLPKGLAALINTSGPRIQAGLNNTRTAGTDHYPTPEHLWEGHGPDRDEDGRPLRDSTASEVGHFGDAARALHGHTSRTASCEYCGKSGHDWQIHPEAHRDVADWEREKHQQEFPFGDYTGDIYPDDGDHDGSAWPGKHGSRLAVNTEGMNPDDHAYGLQAHDPLFGEFGHDGYDYEGVSPRHFKQVMRDYDPEAASQEAREQEDDESGYNWGPEPYDPREASRLPFDRVAGAESAPVAPPQMQPLQAGGYQIGHRIGLDYHGKQFPGTVIGVDGNNANIRWDDGQYSSEEPHNIRLL
jgi:hypothetical protein